MCDLYLTGDLESELDSESDEEEKTFECLLFFDFDLAPVRADVLTKSESEEESEDESKESSLPETSPRLANCLLAFFKS